MPRQGLVRRAAAAILRRVAPPAGVRLEHGRVLDNQLLAGRNALITGAGRNIGRNIALEMARQGASVYFTDIDRASVAGLQRELDAVGVRSRGFVSDIAKPADIEQLCAALLADGIAIDALVNNVGIRSGGGLRDARIADVRSVFETNVFGPLQLTQHVANALVAAGRPGSILFVTSVHASATLGSLAYSASKASLAMVVRELAYELAPYRIRVNGIAPGAVTVDERGELPPFEGAALLGTCIHPAYIGRAAVYLAADYFSQFTTGSVLTVDAGMLSRPVC